MTKKTLITTGDTDTLKKFWEYTYTMKIGRVVDQTLMAIVNVSKDSIISTVSNEGAVEQQLRSGELVTIYFSTGSTTKATKWTYAFSNGVKLNLEGALVLNSDGTLAASSKISKVSMTDVDGILYGIQTVGITNTEGDISFTKTSELVEVTFKLDTFERIFLIDGTPYSGTFGFINRIEKSSSDGSWSASGVIDQFTLKNNSNELLKIEKIDNNQLNANDPEIVEAISSADKFIAYFLKGNDSLKASDNDSSINGYAGNDTIVGGKGLDTLAGGDGNDSVVAGAGADMIIGGDGAGNDTYDGGKGVDSVKYTSARSGIKVDLSKGTATSIQSNDAAGIGTDKLKNIEYIIAGEYADLLTGSKDANSISGGMGDDTIDGGLGNDTLVGGEGIDRFVFSTALSAKNVDTVTDFQVGVDKIQLNKKIFAKLINATDFLALDAKPDSPSPYVIYDSATGKISFDSDGGAGKIKPVDIVFIGQRLELTVTDFLVA